jgi:hypothetical protein
VSDYAQLFFTGARFKVIFTRYTNRGLIDVYVDGTKIDTINASAGVLMWQQTYLSPALTPGNHIVRLVYAGSGTYIDIDALQVYAAATAGIYDDTNSSWLYTGAWAVYNSGGPYNNTLHYTGTLGNAAEFLFNGTRFSVTYTKHTNRGLIDVYVDGVKIDTINANNASLAWQQVYTSPVQTSGNHVVRLVYASGGSYIDIDAIQVYGTPVVGGTYDDANPAWQYAGSWAVFNGSGPSANTIHYTGTVGNSASLLFTGNRFTLTFTKHPNRGLIDVYVDGVKIDTINANAGSLMWQQTYTSPVLSSGNHLVRFVYASGGTYIDVDAITILP